MPSAHSWTISGGEGLIVSVTNNPSTNQTTVGLAAGVQGHLGPYSIEGSMGMNVNLNNHEISGCSDVSLNVGPISCSLTSDNE